MSYTHTLGALTQFAALPSCAPAEVIADARVACNVASSVRGLGAIASMLSLPPAVRAYVDDPAWAQFPSCEVERLPVCPKVSATVMSYSVPATVATFAPPKVSSTVMQYTPPPVRATVATYQPVTIATPPNLTAAPPRVPTPPALVAAPPRVPTPPALKAAPPGSKILMKISPKATLVALPDGTKAIVEEGMSSGAKAGLLALAALAAYGIYRSQKKG